MWTATMAFGDALAIALLKRRGSTAEDFARLHFGGSLGRMLQSVGNLMRTGDPIPRVCPATPVPDAIYEMSRKGLGMTTVVEEDNHQVGIITDGDLRRLMQQRKKEALDLTCGEFMTRSPVTIRKAELAATALHILEERKITSLVVVDAEGRQARLRSQAHSPAPPSSGAGERGIHGENRHAGPRGSTTASFGLGEPASPAARCARHNAGRTADAHRVRSERP